MKIFSPEDLKLYLKNDWIADLLHQNSDEFENKVRTDIWLNEMENKRLIYSDVYGDLLKEKQSSKKVLDVGGGFTSLTKVLAQNSDYSLLDYMAHGDGDIVNNEAQKYHFTWINEDWYNFSTDRFYDLVIANDIFPDVDQRMELFLDKYLKICKELRIVITWYNDPKFYVTQRLDDTEKLTFLSWDGEITALKLKKYIDRMYDTSEKQLISMKDCKTSIYKNGRQIAYLKLKGI